ncbi:MAG: hypothetical protein RLZ75_1917 [Pseudomonadota bacterium]|jgi:addiction module RelE/StbE family toxin
MTTDYQVIWTKTAQSDVLAILSYIKKDSPLAAKEIFNKLKAQAKTLVLFSERGRVVPELLNQGICLYREIIMTPWRVVYRIVDKEVFVLAVIDARRNVEDVLLECLIRTNNENSIS